MALPPPLRARAIGDSRAPHSLELYLDFLCPFSAKQLDGVATHLLPLITGPDAPYQNKVRILLRPYPQPWHSSSPLVCEAAVAVARLAAPRPGPSYQDDWDRLCDPATNAAWVFALELMRVQDKYYDGPSRNRNPDQIRSDMASLVVSTLSEVRGQTKGKPLLKPQENGLPLGQAIKNLLRVAPEGNAGSKVVADLKWCVKAGRQNGVHSTPSVLCDGLLEPAITSSFGAEEWKAYLEKLLVADQEA